jgi:prepilin-type processing-associated H-X9-DG protein
MPSLANARLAAKQAACLANEHNIGLALQTYVGSNNSYFPTDYSYVNGSSSAGGYQQWTATINPQFYTAAPTYYATAATPDTAVGYPMMSPDYVSPSHIIGGFAPTDFTTFRIPTPPSGQTAATSTLDDMQVPRISYLPNEAIMPRKKYSAAQDIAGAGTAKDTSGLQLVSSDIIDHTNTTILLAMWSQNLADTEGTSSGGGQAFKTHRPTNAVETSTGGVFNGETYTTDGTAGFMQMSLSHANTVFATAQTIAAGPASGWPGGMDGLDHISYLNPNAYQTGSNYLFCDGHAAKYSLSDTLNPSAYLWGTHMWSCGTTATCSNNEIAPNTTGI